MIIPSTAAVSIVTLQDISGHPRPDRAGLSLNRVAASLQVMLATRRAARNEARAEWYEARRSA